MLSVIYEVIDIPKFLNTMLLNNPPSEWSVLKIGPLPVVALEVMTDPLQKPLAPRNDGTDATIVIPTIPEVPAAK